MYDLGTLTTWLLNHGIRSDKQDNLIQTALVIIIITSAVFEENVEVLS